MEWGEHKGITAGLFKIDSLSGKKKRSSLKTSELFDQNEKSVIYLSKM